MGGIRAMDYDASRTVGDFCNANHIICEVEHDLCRMTKVKMEHIPSGRSFVHTCWRLSPKEIGVIISKAQYLFELPGPGYIKYCGGIDNAEITKVIFNNPATIVIWDDGSKTVVKAENEPFDPEKGLAMAIAKKALGNKGNYYETFKKHLPKTKKLEFKPVAVGTIYDGKLPIAEVNAVIREEGGLRIETTPVMYVSTSDMAEKAGVSVDAIRKQCAAGLLTGAIKVNGKWRIPIKGRFVDGKWSFGDYTEE